MKFGARGRFKTEDIVDIAMRCMAELQDADIEYVSGVNLYLTPTDKSGRQRSILKDGQKVDQLHPIVDDLVLPEAEVQVSTVYTDEYQSARKRSGSGRRSKYNRK